MKRLMQFSLMAVVAVALSMFAVGCSSSSNSGSGGGGSSSGVVDMVVGDHGWDTNVSQILIWFDILNSVNLSSTTTSNGVPVPNVVLLNAASSDAFFPHFAFQGNDLYVEVNRSGPTSVTSPAEIDIYRNYLTLTSGATPDVVLSATTNTPLDYPWGFDVRSNRIFVADANLPGVVIYDGTDTLTTGDDADVILDSATSLLTDPRGVVYDAINDKLYVGNWSSTAGEPCVAVFSAVTGIISGGVAVAPTAVLNADTLDVVAPNLDGCREVILDNGTLYVAGGYDGYAYVFNNANSFTSGTLPDVILQGTTDATTGDPTLINTVASLAVFNNTLYVANRNAEPCCSDDNVKQANPGIVGFPVSGLTNGAIPSIQFLHPAFLNTVNRVAFAGGAMFVVGDGLGYEQFNINHVYIYKNASSLTTNQAPDIFIAGSSDPALSPFPSVAPFNSPTSLALNTR